MFSDRYIKHWGVPTRGWPLVRCAFLEGITGYCTHPIIASTAVAGKKETIHPKMKYAYVLINSCTSVARLKTVYCTST